jgi:general transcription factor IIIA
VGKTDKRYTCAHPTCLSSDFATPTFYPNWSTLQHHIRTDHPPTCPHPSCNGRTFTQQQGLRAHLRLHEQREVDAELESALAWSDFDAEDGNEPSKKRRRGGEAGRDWKCTMGDCEKAFKSVRNSIFVPLESPIDRLVEKSSHNAL